MTNSGQSSSGQAHQNLISELNRHRRQLMQLLSKLDVSGWPRQKAIPESTARRRFGGDPANTETLLFNYRDLLAPVAGHTPDLWSEDVTFVHLPNRPNQRLPLSLEDLDDWRDQTVTMHQPSPGLGSQRHRVTERVFLPPAAVRKLANRLLAVQQQLGIGIQVEAAREGDVATGGRDEDTGDIDLPTDPWETVSTDNGDD